MKTAQDPRHLKRIALIKQLYTFSFNDKLSKTRDFRNILPHLPSIDKLIESCASEWPIDKIAKVDLAILRLAVYELIIAKETPFKVIIDEAVEIAKEYGNPTSSSFINGVLGSIIKRNLDKA